MASQVMFEEEPVTEVISILGKLGPFKAELRKKWQWVQSLGPHSQVKQDILVHGRRSQVTQRAITLWHVLIATLKALAGRPEQFAAWVEHVQLNMSRCSGVDCSRQCLVRTYSYKRCCSISIYSN